MVALPGLMAHPIDTVSRKIRPEPPVPVSFRCQLEPVILRRPEVLTTARSLAGEGLVTSQ
jgi:hypothetical protein